MTDADRERASLDDGREVVVTPFREVHRPSLARMYDDYPPEHRSLGLPRLLAEEREAWLSGVLEAGRNFVAVVDGTVVGHAVYAPADAEVTDFVIFVDPAFHELGIGSSLLRYAISTAPERGWSASSATPRPTTPAPSTSTTRWASSSTSRPGWSSR